MLRSNCAHLKDQQLNRSDVLQQAFGEHAKAFQDNLREQAKAHFEAYKFKVNAQKPVYASRAEKDVRGFEVKFTFSSKNPYFKETTLSKKLSVTPPFSVKKAPPAPSSFDLDALLYLIAPSFPISWTSPEHDLAKKAPRAKANELEEYDAFSGLGSLFNWFGEEGEDVMGLGESLLEWYGHASEYAAGLASLDEANSSDGGDLEGLDFSDLEDDDESEDDADPKKEIDLDEQEHKRPKKKVKSRK